MKKFCTLFWTAIIVIAVERCRAEFLLVEVDDAPAKGSIKNISFNLCTYMES